MDAVDEAVASLFPQVARRKPYAIDQAVSELFPDIIGKSALSSPTPAGEEGLLTPVEMARQRKEAMDLGVTPKSLGEPETWAESELEGAGRVGSVLGQVLGSAGQAASRGAKNIA